MGMQFFDVAVYAIGSGGVCLAVYRGLQGDEFGEIWSFPDAPQSTASEVIVGAVVGAMAGGVGIAFRRCAMGHVLRRRFRCFRRFAITLSTAMQATSQNMVPYQMLIYHNQTGALLFCLGASPSKHQRSELHMTRARRPHQISKMPFAGE